VRRSLESTISPESLVSTVRPFALASAARAASEVGGGRVGPWMGPLGLTMVRLLGSEGLEVDAARVAETAAEWASASFSRKDL